jgi:hypothetical protein
MEARLWWIVSSHPARIARMDIWYRIPAGRIYLSCGNAPVVNIPNIKDNTG